MEQPSLRTIINQVEWKSDNYGNKEAISIQTGRRGRVTEQAGPNLHVVDKNSEGIFEEQRVPGPQ